MKDKAPALIYRYASTITGFLFLRYLSAFKNSDILFYFLFIQPFINLIPIIDLGNKNLLVAKKPNDQIQIFILNNLLITLIVTSIFVILMGLNLKSYSFFLFIIIQLALYPMELLSINFMYSENPKKYNLIVLFVQIILFASYYVYFNLTSKISNTVLIILASLWVLLPTAMPILFSKIDENLKFKFQINLIRIKSGTISSLLYLVGYLGISYISILLSGNKIEMINYSLILRIVNIASVFTLYYQIFIGQINNEKITLKLIKNITLLSVFQAVLVLISILILKKYVFYNLYYDFYLLVLIFIYSLLLGYSAYVNFNLLRNGMVLLFLKIDLVALAAMLIIRSLFEVNIYSAFFQMIIWEIITIISFFVFYKKNYEKK